MTVTSHRYTAVAKRPGKRDGILSLMGGTISLDGTRAPHVRATLQVAVPASWAPLAPANSGHWEPTGATQFPFLDPAGAPPFMISEPAQRWVADPPSWVSDPLEDDEEIILNPDPQPFIPAGGAPPFFISQSAVHIIPPPRPAELRDIDPRDAPRVLITAQLVNAFGMTKTRAFDLVLRDRGVAQDDGTITLDLASDETLVDDHAPLVDDSTPLLLDTLEDITRYVLETVFDSVDFEYPTSVPLVAAWTAQNMLSNPTARNNADGWTAGVGAGAPVWTAALGANGEPGYVQVTHSAPVGHILISEAEPWIVRANAGRRYAFAASVRSPHAMAVRIGVQYRNDAGAVLARSTSDWTTASTTWQRLRFAAAAAPAGTTRVVQVVEWSDSAAGRVLQIDCASLDEGEYIPDYFDGSTVDTPTYSFSWGKDAHASPSRRTLLVDAPRPDALTWRAGVGGIRFLASLVQAAGYRLICTEDRKWHLRDAEWTASGEVKIAYAENMIDGSDVISRDSDWFDAAVVNYRWMVDGVQREQSTFFALPDHTMVRTFEINAPYPGPGLAEYAVTRAQGRGRTVTATAVADWDVAADMPATVVLNGAVPQLGTVNAVTFDLTADEMTITTRTIDTGSTP